MSIRRPLWTRVAFLAVLFLISVPAFDTAVRAADEQEVYVTVRESKLRGKPDFFTPASGDVKYGDRLSVVSTSGAWVLVKTGAGKQGYVHQSAITDKRVVLKSKAEFTPAGADANDVVLAGKGFSAEVEREFAATHRGLDFAAVNAMERIKVTPAELAKFAQAGKLGGQ